MSREDLLVAGRTERSGCKSSMYANGWKDAYVPYRSTAEGLHIHSCERGAASRAKALRGER
jgi:hypothetical protein